METERKRELPGAAKFMIETAADAGWLHVINWDADTAGHEFVSVEIGRSTPLYIMRITWHSRPTGGRTLRLFSKIWRHVPAEPGSPGGFWWVDAPSLKKLREVIMANPVKE